MKLADAKVFTNLESRIFIRHDASDIFTVKVSAVNQS